MEQDKPKNFFKKKEIMEEKEEKVYNFSNLKMLLKATLLTVTREKINVNSFGSLKRSQGELA